MSGRLKRSFSGFLVSIPRGYYSIVPEQKHVPGLDLGLIVLKAHHVPLRARGHKVVNCNWMVRLGRSPYEPFLAPYRLADKH